MHEVHGVIEKERLILVAGEEVDGEGLDNVRIVGVLTGIDDLTILFVAVLPVIAAGRRVGDVFVETPIVWRLADLPPFAGLASHVPALFHHSGDGPLVGRFGAGTVRPPGTVRKTARAKRVTPGHEQTTRRTAQRRGVAGLEAGARGGEFVDIGSAMRIGAVATHAIDTQVIREDEENIRPGFRRGEQAGHDAEKGEQEETKEGSHTN